MVIGKEPESGINGYFQKFKKLNRVVLALNPTAIVSLNYGSMTLYGAVNFTILTAITFACNQSKICHSNTGDIPRDKNIE